MSYAQTFPQNLFIIQFYLDRPVESVFPSHTLVDSQETLNGKQEMHNSSNPSECTSNDSIVDSSFAVPALSQEIDPRNALAMARKAVQDRIALGLPARRNPIEKANENPQSLRCAINAKCYECVGMDDDPNFRDSIRACAGYSCPLYAHRPYQVK